MESGDETTSQYDHETVVDARPGLTRAQAFNLYISHAFSTWNARGYEFAVILFTAAAYPDTLVAAALRKPSAATPLWFVLPRNDPLKGIIFAVAVTFGIIERLSASGNLISMERDWVVTVAGPTGHPYDLTNLNAVMRRIDLVCKLISPILISIVISATGSVRIGVLYTGFTSLISIPIELISAKRVWNGSRVLQASKPVPVSAPTQDPTAGEGETETRSEPWPSRIRQYFKGLELYFTSPAWIPSFALAMLHFNMLTWRATFITYLINIGYSLNVITVARAIGSIFEISSTVITPRGIVYLGKTGRRGTVSSDGSEDSLLASEPRTDDSISNTQTIVGLHIPVVLALWAISAQRDQATGEDARTLIPRIFGDAMSLNVGWSVILFSFLAFSRLGVWIYDLTTQQLTQTLVYKTQRSSFAGVENSVINVFEVLGAGAAIAFPKVEQYRWLALASLVSVAISWSMYAFWVRSQRGHLLHWEKLGSTVGDRR
ncbi:hypothetical protein CIB48_g9888 [Xylaria polymorpha]|nr:hypothetical protein CIB48_g9888 [Xylaria polymorpha]